jgi:hypothetical protein
MDVLGFLEMEIEYCGIWRELELKKWLVAQR